MNAIVDPDNTIFWQDGNFFCSFFDGTINLPCWLLVVLCCSRHLHIIIKVKLWQHCFAIISQLTKAKDHWDWVFFLHGHLLRHIWKQKIIIWLFLLSFQQQCDLKWTTVTVADWFLLKRTSQVLNPLDLVDMAGWKKRSQDLSWNSEDFKRYRQKKQQQKN